MTTSVPFPNVVNVANVVNGANGDVPTEIASTSTIQTIPHHDELVSWIDKFIAWGLPVPDSMTYFIAGHISRNKLVLYYPSAEIRLTPYDLFYFDSCRAGVTIYHNKDDPNVYGRFLEGFTTKVPEDICSIREAFGKTKCYKA